MRKRVKVFCLLLALITISVVMPGIASGASELAYRDVLFADNDAYIDNLSSNFTFNSTDNCYVSSKVRFYINSKQPKMSVTGIKKECLAIQGNCSVEIINNITMYHGVRQMEGYTHHYYYFNTKYHTNKFSFTYLGFSEDTEALIGRVMAKVYLINVIPATKVVLNKTGTLVIPIGGTDTIEGTQKPENATTKLHYSSSNSSIVSITNTGAIFGVSEGTATIFATTTNNKSASVKVKVVDEKAPEELTIGGMDTVVNFGESETFTAFVSNRFDKAEAQLYEWSINTAGKKLFDLTTDNNTATVTAKKEGTAILTCKATYKGKKATSVKATIKITATDTGIPEKLVLSEKSLTLDIGEETSVLANVTNKFDRAIATDYKWSIDKSGSKIVSLSGSEMTATLCALKAGNATVTCTAVYKGAKKVIKTASLKITVVDKSVPSSLHFDKSSVTLPWNSATTTITAYVDNKYGLAHADSYVWSIDKKGSSLLQLQDDGEGTVSIITIPGKSGTATLTCTATHKGLKKTVKTASIKVKVINPFKLSAVRAVDEQGATVSAITLKAGEECTLFAVTEPAITDGLIDYKWTSSSGTKVFVSSQGATATIQGIEKGSATITLTASRPEGTQIVKKQATVKVTITK